MTSGWGVSVVSPFALCLCGQSFRTLSLWSVLSHSVSFEPGSATPNPRPDKVNLQLVRQGPQANGTNRTGAITPPHCLRIACVLVRCDVIAVCFISLVVAGGCTCAVVCCVHNLDGGSWGVATGQSAIVIGTAVGGRQAAGRGRQAGSAGRRSHSASPATAGASIRIRVGALR